MAQQDMAQQDVIMPVEAVGELPDVREIAVRDVWDALAKGLDDFRAMPTHVIFLGLLYPIAGLLIGYLTFGRELVPLLYPLISGFALIGPFAAIGLYELSRRREAGLDTSWSHAFDVLHSPSLRSILALGALLLAIFIAWLFVAHAIYAMFFGPREPTSIIEFARQVLSTPAGHALIVVGNIVGAMFAIAAFTVSVISFPLLLDRHVGVHAALITSMRAVAANPIPMGLWAAIVVAGLVLGSLPLLMGLAVVMPVLGHATWHLYRKVVVANARVRPEFVPRQKEGVRYAADFPASLFSRYKGRQK